MQELDSIVLQNVSFYYENATKPALRELNLTIKRGEFVWITGPGGSGKTTLLQLISGLLTTEDEEWEMKGRLQVEGFDLTAPKERSALAGNVGIVFQDPEAGMIQPYVEDELAFGPENLRIPPSEIDRRIEAALNHVGLSAMRHSRTSELSGGQKQRVSIAAVLTMHPGILLLDEAAASLDEPSSERLMTALGELHRHGQTIAFASTRMPEAAAALADRAVVLDKGAMVADGAPEELVNNHRQQLIELGCIMDASAPASAFAAGIDKENVSEQRSPLLEVRGLTYSYYHASKSRLFDKQTMRAMPIINDINFRLDAGDFLAVLGPNGTGKTTLGKLVAGVLPPPKQHIFVHGNDICHLSSHGQIGYVFQNPEHQFVAETVMEECVYGLKMKRGLHPWDETPEDILQYGLQYISSSQIELASHTDQHPYRLNASAKRMLSLLSVMITEPDVLVLDEPTAGLDYRSARHVMEACATFARQGKAVVMITHDRNLVKQWATKVVTFEDSKHG